MVTAAREARREDRRDHILDVAQDCFLAEGYGATSMSTIAARLGGSKGTLYNYFKSKEELFDAFVRRSCARLACKLFDLASDESGDARERLVRLAQGFLTFLLSSDAMAVHRLVVGEGERFPELGRVFYTAGPSVVIGRIAELFAGMMDRGMLRRADPEVAAHQFKDLAISGVYQLRLWGVIGDPAPAEIAVRAETAVDTFLRAYAP
jgi:AcrR family transcriptional regulator